MTSPPSLAGVFQFRVIIAPVGGVSDLKLVGASGNTANAAGKAPTETEETKINNIIRDKILRCMFTNFINHINRFKLNHSVRLLVR